MSFLRQFHEDLHALLTALRKATPATDAQGQAALAELEDNVALLEALSRAPLPTRDPAGRPYPQQANIVA